MAVISWKENILHGENESLYNYLTIKQQICLQMFRTILIKLKK